MEPLTFEQRKRRHTVSMLPFGPDTLPVYLCPSCGRDSQFRYIGGSYPGWECGCCHQFHSDFNWDVENGKLVKKHHHIPRKSYVDKKALSSSNTVKKDPVKFQWNGGFSEDKLTIEEAIEEMSL